MARFFFTFLRRLKSGLAAPIRGHLASSPAARHRRALPIERVLNLPPDRGILEDMDRSAFMLEVGNGPHWLT